MKSLEYDKDTLLKIVKENREDHKTEFIEAWNNYVVAVRKWFESQLEKATARERFETHFPGPTPTSMTADYDRAIRMLELTTETVITLHETEFRQLVLDEWSWSDNFIATSSVYRA